VKLCAALLDEVGVVLSFLLDACLFSFIGNFVDDCILFFLREEVWNLTGVKEVVNVFEEVFTDDLVVGKNELLLVFSVTGRC
jgi:hypothetical protein